MLAGREHSTLRIRGGEWSTYPRIYLSKVWISRPFKEKGDLSKVWISRPFLIEGRFIQGMEKFTFLLLWLQWISLKSLLNVDLCLVFYIYIQDRCSQKWWQTYMWLLCAIYSSLWVLLNGTRFYDNVHFTSTVAHALYTAQWPTPSESHISLWSTRIA